MASQWYYSINRQKFGPFTDEQIVDIFQKPDGPGSNALIFNREVTGNSWVKADEIDGLVPGSLPPLPEELPPLPPEDPLPLKPAVAKQADSAVEQLKNLETLKTSSPVEGQSIEEQRRQKVRKERQNSKDTQAGYFILLGIMAVLLCIILLANMDFSNKSPSTSEKNRLDSQQQNEDKRREYVMGYLSEKYPELESICANGTDKEKAIARFALAQDNVGNNLYIEARSKGWIRGSLY